ncbi:MAG: response regulator [Desulfobacteraceae bacterium]|nr:response regulator [Desulfobacteraceae bacterium]MBC2720527.1 response regulator [Desulfobacteraceae bacterium]
MKKALIVDDIPEYVDTMEAYLEDMFDVLTAQSLEEAKSVLKDNPIDLAIIDIRLNEENPGNKEGIDLLKWLRERMPEAGVIVMSAYEVREIYLGL